MRIVGVALMMLMACGKVADEVEDAAVIDAGPDAPPIDAGPDADPSVPGATQADARASCQAIRNAGVTTSGVYWMDPNGGDTADAFEVLCEMTTLGGGWTMVMNVHPSDGDFVPFTNTEFWLANTEYGQFSNRNADYKSPAAWQMAGTNILVQAVEPGGTPVIGWKAWGMPAPKAFDTFFDGAVANSTQTDAVLGEDVANVYAWEPLIKNGQQLQSNRLINPNSDRIRLGATGYSAQGDDNSPGLGTQMNEGQCGVGVLCFRYKDVELWVDSNSNLWCSTPSPGSYKWIGTDGGCGASCNGCDNTASPPYSPYWTYRIYLR